MDTTQKQIIFRALTAKKAVPVCARCEGAGHDIAGFSFVPLHDDPRAKSENPPSIPVVVVVCVTCGNVTQHVLSSLGVEI